MALETLDTILDSISLCNRFYCRVFILLLFSIVPLVFQLASVHFVDVIFNNGSVMNTTNHNLSYLNSNDLLLNQESKHFGSCPDHLFDGEVNINLLRAKDGVPQVLCETWAGLDHMTLLFVTSFFGWLLGSLSTGCLSDKYGRLTLLIINHNAMLVSGMVMGFVTIYWHMVCLRFITGFFAGGVFISMFILIVEFFGPSHRGVPVLVLGVTMTISVMVLPALFLGMSSWRNFSLVASTPWFVLTLIVWYLPQSVRWLLVTRRAPRAKKILQRMKNWKLTRHTMEVLNIASLVKASSYRYCTCSTLFRNKEMMRRVGPLTLHMYTLGLVSHQLYSSSLRFLGSIHLDFILTHVFDVPALILFYACTLKIGRRCSSISFSISCGLLNIVLPFISSSNSPGWVTLHYAVKVLALIFLLTSICSTLMYAFELLPTSLRSTALGILLSAFSFGIISSSFLQVVSLTEVTQGVSGATCAIAAVILLILPDTLYCPTPDVPEECTETRHYELEDSSSDFGRARVSASEGINSQRVEITSYRKTDETPAEKPNSLDASLFDSNEWSWEVLDHSEGLRRISDIIEDPGPQLMNKSDIMNEQHVLQLSDHLPARVTGSNWMLAYSTYEDGTSLNTLYRKMAELEIPVLLVLKDEKDAIFGVFTSSPPSICRSFCGTGESFFFTLTPEFQVYKWSGVNDFVMKGDKNSLGFGCGDGTYGLWIDEELYHGRSCPCPTFQNKILSSSEEFLCHGLEAWTFP